jgi:hypothetical protein
MRAVLRFATSSCTSKVQEEDNWRAAARATRNANADAADSDNSADWERPVGRTTRRKGAAAQARSKRQIPITSEPIADQSESRLSSVLFVTDVLHPIHDLAV